MLSVGSQTDDTIERLTGAIQKYWGYESFLPLQEDSMRCGLENRDSVVVLPTGGGKSLCYQVPAVCRDGLTLVVSPLISLMKDQVDALTQCGVPAACVNSTMPDEARRVVAERISSGELKLLYIAPERLMQERTLRFLETANLSMVAVDEAHCISSWGHDFRPEYRGLKVFKQRFSGLGVHAYTATATEQVRRDIAEQLQLSKPTFLVGSFDRPNLVYSVCRVNNRFAQICEVVDRHRNESGVIYCISRKEVDKTAAALSQLGYQALPYHAGLSDEERHRHQDAFIKEEAHIIVATVAFGMGIDKSNVRYVVHSGMPKSLENYQQESGRAGRDGLEAECRLLFSGNDFHTWKRMLDGGDSYQGALRSLSAMSGYCNAVTCRHQAIIEHFGQSLSAENCGACDVCLGELDLVADAQVVGQKILSCVARLEQRFGTDYTAKVLTGSQEQRIQEAGHDTLSTYGLLKTESLRTVRDWIEQLVGQKFLAKEGEYNTLSLTDAGWQLLRGELTPRLLRSVAQPRAPATDDAGSWEGVDRGLFEELRTLRKKRADEQAVPAYVVFGDATLRDMARRRPTSADAMRQVKGVGEKKLADYGPEFIDGIKRYCCEHEVATDVASPDRSVSANVGNLADSAGEKRTANSSQEEKTPIKRASIPAFEFFRQGMSVAEVAERLNRATSTTYGYLNDFIRHEELTNATPWVKDVVISQVEEAASAASDERLKPIFDALDGEVSYEDIRIVVACLRNRLQSIDS